MHQENLTQAEEYLRNLFILERTRRGISQEKMAEKLQISLRCYWNIEHGKNSCRIETFSNLVRLMEDPYDFVDYVIKMDQSQRNE